MKELEHSGKNTRESGMLNALTSFRFIAALMVFVWHTRVFSTFLAKFELGYVGVGFFYILSGFILVYVYFSKLRTPTMHSVQKFYIARLAKIYPLHILTFLLTIPLVLGFMNGLMFDETRLKVIGTVLSNIFLLQSYSSDQSVHFSFNGVAWSISVEMFFYALFPLIIFLLGKYYKVLTVRNWLILMTTGWLVLLLLVLPHQSYVDDWRFYIFPLMRLPDFLVGMMLGLLFVKLNRTNQLQRYVDRFSFTKLELASITLLLCGMIVSVFLPQSVRFAVWLMPFWVIVIFVFAQQRGWLSRVLSFRPLVYLGEISFSFYMIHQLVIRYILELHLPKSLMVIVSLAVSIALSSLVYLYFEEPVRMWLKSFLEKCIIRKRKARADGVLALTESIVNEV